MSKNRIDRLGLKHGYTNLHELVVCNPGRVSWERFEGPNTFATACFEKHLIAGWLQIRVCEQGAKTSREAYITLDPTQVEGLRALLSATK